MAYVLYLEDFARSSDWRDCTAQGDVSEAVEYLVRQYRPKFAAIPLGNVRAHLRECGAWDDLDEADADQLYQRLAFSEAANMLETGMIWID